MLDMENSTSNSMMQREKIYHHQKKVKNIKVIIIVCVSISRAPK